MDGKTALRRLCPSVPSLKSCWVSLCAYSECRPTRALNRGKTLIFTLLLSFGLWALIWLAVTLLVACEVR
jgi:hypothetical protein